MIIFENKLSKKILGPNMKMVSGAVNTTRNKGYLQKQWYNNASKIKTDEMGTVAHML